MLGILYFLPKNICCYQQMNKCGNLKREGYILLLLIGFYQTMLCHICEEINRIKSLLWITNEHYPIPRTGLFFGLWRQAIGENEMMITIINSLMIAFVDAYLHEQFPQKQISKHSSQDLIECFKTRCVSGNLNKLPISSALVFSFYRAQAPIYWRLFGKK